MFTAKLKDAEFCPVVIFQGLVCFRNIVHWYWSPFSSSPKHEHYFLNVWKHTPAVRLTSLPFLERFEGINVVFSNIINTLTDFT